MTASNTMLSPLEEELIQWAERYQEDLESLSAQIHKQPELSGEEHVAADLHMQLLRKRGFSILHPFWAWKPHFGRSTIPGFRDLV